MVAVGHDDDDDNDDDDEEEPDSEAEVPSEDSVEVEDSANSLGWQKQQSSLDIADVLPPSVLLPCEHMHTRDSTELTGVSKAIDWVAIESSLHWGGRFLAFSFLRFRPAAPLGSFVLAGSSFPMFGCSDVHDPVALSFPLSFSLTQCDLFFLFPLTLSLPSISSHFRSWHDTPLPRFPRQAPTPSPPSLPPPPLISHSKFLTSVCRHRRRAAAQTESHTRGTDRSPRVGTHGRYASGWLDQCPRKKVTEPDQFIRFASAIP